MAEKRDKKYINFLSWFSSILLISAAYIITLIPESALHIPVFIMFLVSHILLSTYTMIRKEWALLALNVNFVLLDIIGIVIRL